jgi:hypothetical protein
MMLGGLPDLNEFKQKAKTIGENNDISDIEKLKAEQKWMKWAIIFLIAYILYKETK